MLTVNPFYAARTAKRTSASIARYNVLDLFSGVGGFSLGLERAGMNTVAFCEIDPFCQQVLKNHWPHLPIHSDIKQLTARRLHHDNIPPIDLLCGGYPCQPFSIAGKRRGFDDPRHLWPEMYRLIREFRPRWVICENVGGHVELGLDTVLGDLDDAGYTATPFVIPACAVGAPHRRDRVWVVAHSRRIGFVASPASQFAQKISGEPIRWELPAPFTIGRNDGLPHSLDRIKALGNAVVPQIPELIGRAIIAHEFAYRSRLN